MSSDRRNQLFRRGHLRSETNDTLTALPHRSSALFEQAEDINPTRLEILCRN